MKEFINEIKLRLNKGIAIRALLLSTIIASCITLIWGLTYIIRGHAVESSIVYPAGLLIIAILALAIWKVRKKSELQSAIFADNFYHLKDSLASALEFQQTNKEGHIYELQKQQAINKIKEISPQAIPLPFSRKLSIVAGISAIAAGSLSLATPSDEVLKAIKEREITSARTEEIQKTVEKEVENLINSLSDEEKEAIDPDAIRQWVKELKKTDDKREALRNIARVEQKIQKSIDKLQNRKNEETLKAAGIKMLQAKNQATKDIGKSLKNKNFKKAAAKLEKFKLNQNNIKKTKLDKKKMAQLKADAKDPNKKKALNKKQKQLAKLRELTKRLSQAAQQNRNQSNPSSSETMSMEQFAELLEEADINKLPEELNLEDLKELPQDLLDQLPPELLNKFPRELLNQLPPELLEKLLEMLENNAQDLQENMDEMELDMMEGDPMSQEEWEELLEQLENMDMDIEALQKMLERMEAMKNMREKLQGLQKMLGQSQISPSEKELFLRKSKGGKKPGFGSDSSRRKNKDKLKNNKQHTKIKGKKGIGPVKSSVESADSGSGVSRRKGTAKKRSHEKQMSSFIDREDVSEEMKQAVKQYFQDIHSIQKPSNQKSN